MNKPLSASHTQVSFRFTYSEPLDELQEQLPLDSAKVALHSKHTPLSLHFVQFLGQPSLVPLFLEILESFDDRFIILDILVLLSFVLLFVLLGLLRIVSSMPSI